MGHKLRSDPAETVSRSREQAFATRATIVMVLAVLIAPKTGTGDRQIYLTDRDKYLEYVGYLIESFGGSTDFRPAWSPSQDRQ
jgi:hypothetical protein